MLWDLSDVDINTGFSRKLNALSTWYALQLLLDLMSDLGLCIAKKIAKEGARRIGSAAERSGQEELSLSNQSCY